VKEVVLAVVVVGRLKMGQCCGGCLDDGLMKQAKRWF